MFKVPSLLEAHMLPGEQYYSGIHNGETIDGASWFVALTRQEEKKYGVFIGSLDGGDLVGVRTNKEINFRVLAGVGRAATDGSPLKKVLYIGDEFQMSGHYIGIASNTNVPFIVRGTYASKMPFALYNEGRGLGFID